jgi:hypothetical protein
VSSSPSAVLRYAPSLHRSQALLLDVDDKANGSAVIPVLKHQVPGLVPDEPDGLTTAHAAGACRWSRRRNVRLPAFGLCPWVGESSTSAPESQPRRTTTSPLSQALTWLILMPLLAGQDLGDGSSDASCVVTYADLEAQLVGFGSYRPPPGLAVMPSSRSWRSRWSERVGRRR